MTEQEKRIIRDDYMMALSFRDSAHRRMLNRIQEPHARLAREFWIEWKGRCQAIESLMAMLGIELNK